MKKNLFFILCVCILFSCNQNNKKSDTHGKDTHIMATDTNLTLNNGGKWKADSITNHNLIRLKVTANMFRVAPFPSVNNYQILGKDLSNDADTILQQCKMTGADHEALHKWLNPIITQTAQLKKITDTAEARKIFDLVDERINTFHQYFK